MDALEIVMELEERFDVSLDDGDFPQVETVGDLQAMVLAKVQRKLAEREAQPCLTRRLFYEVRDLTREFVDQPTLRLHPRASLVDTIPRRQQIRYCQLLQARLGFKRTPILARPRWVRRTIAGVTLSTLTLTILAAPLAPNWLPWGLLLTAILPPLLLWRTQNWRQLKPTDPTTFAQLIRQEVGTTPTPPPEIDLATWISEEVQEVIALQLRIEPEKVVPSSNLVKDLGMS
ncbi:MAG: hypothetical protein WD045_12135 [Pirellulaceae bacterium]